MKTSKDVSAPHVRTGIFIGDEGLRSGWGITFFVLICVCAFLVVSRLHLLPSQPEAQPGQPSPELSPRSSIVGESILLAIVTGATLILSKVEHRSVGTYGISDPKPVQHFLQGLLSGLVLLSLLVLVLWQSNLIVIDRLLLPPVVIVQYAVVWAFGFLIVALFEETFLRGYLQFTLARGLSAVCCRFTTSERAATFGFWAAGLILCTIFGLGHGANGGESPFGLFTVGLFGLTFVFSLWRTGSLWWAIGAHTSWNWAQSFVYGVGNSGNMVRYYLLASHPVGEPLLSGGATGPEGSIFVLPTLALLAAAAFFAAPRAHRAYKLGSRQSRP